MEHELESFYFEHYCWWFRQGQFGKANGMIPMVNIFDDHDIVCDNTLIMAAGLTRYRLMDSAHIQITS